MLPRVVAELGASIVGQVQCGEYYTLVLTAVSAKAAVDIDVIDYWLTQEVRTRILGRRTAPFLTVPYSLPRAAWFYPRS